MASSIKNLMMPSSRSKSAVPSGSVGMPAGGSIPRQSLSVDHGRAHTGYAPSPKGNHTFPSAGTRMPSKKPGC